MAGGNRKASRARQPITRHSLFPAIVALWFCALFALGSLAIRVTLLESAVVASGIDLIVPAAAPPLGLTARILLALMLGMFGALIGYALGARIGRTRPEAPQRRRTNLGRAEPPLPRRADHFVQVDSPPPRPLSAFDELGDHAAQIASSELGTASPRRRALALAEPTEPDYAQNHAPLPGGETPVAACFDNDHAEVLDLAEALPEEIPMETFVPKPDPFVRTSPAVIEPGHAPEVGAAAAQVSRPFDQSGDARRFAQPATAAPPPSSSMPRLMAADPLGAMDRAEEDDRGLPPRNLGMRFGSPASASLAPAEVEAAPESDEMLPPHPTPEAAAPALRPVSGSAAERLRSIPLENLSQLELIERLALSMQQRRDAAEAAATLAPAEPQGPLPMEAALDTLPRFGFEPRTPLPLDELLAPFAAAQGTPIASSIPAALRPIGFDAEPAEEEAADDLLPRFAFAQAVNDGPSDEPQREDGDVNGASFSSLLEVGRTPLRQPLIRIEEPIDEQAPIEPVVVFPGHGSRPFAAPAPTATAFEPATEPLDEAAGRRFDPPGVAAQAAAAAAPQQDPEESERALRAALATLQRMSGAA